MAAVKEGLGGYNEVKVFPNPLGEVRINAGPAPFRAFPSSYNANWYGFRQVILNKVNLEVIEDIVPERLDKTINYNPLYYHGLESVSIVGSDTLISGNIRKGASIYGVDGTYAKPDIKRQSFSITATENHRTYDFTPEPGYDCVYRASVYVNVESELDNISELIINTNNLHGELTTYDINSPQY